MKKLLLFLFIFLFVFNYTLSEEEDISINDFIEDESVRIDEKEAKYVLGEPKPTLSPDEMYKEQDGTTVIKITAGGNLIFGDMLCEDKSLFQKELAKQDGNLNFPFENIKSIFKDDDVTILNLKTCFASSNDGKLDKELYSKVPRSYVNMFSDKSVEVLNIENKSTKQHGDSAYEETKQALTNTGISFCDQKQISILKIKNKKIAVLSYYGYKYDDETVEYLKRDLSSAKTSFDISIVCFSWAEENTYNPSDTQKSLARKAVDLGADLVIGYNSSCVNPIELYNDKYIVYSMGDLINAADNKPSDMTSYLFQIKFILRDDGVKNTNFRIVPCRISSRVDYNDFKPTPYDKEINIYSLIKILEKNSEGLEGFVKSYPLEF